MTDDYPEPDGARERCAYCGRKTHALGGLHESPYGPYQVAFKVCCARSSCLDRAADDPDFAVRYPLDHRPS